LEAGLRAAEKARASFPTSYNNSHKNGMWRRVSALSKLVKAIDILGPEEGGEGNPDTRALHDTLCHTIFEVAGERPPLDPSFATGTIRRGVGRKSKCGKKRKADRVRVAEDKDEHNMGIDTHKEYN
jgi:hypothetical protein